MIGSRAQLFRKCLTSTQASKTNQLTIQRGCSISSFSTGLTLHFRKCGPPLPSEILTGRNQRWWYSFERHFQRNSVPLQPLPHRRRWYVRVVRRDSLTSWNCGIPSAHSFLALFFIQAILSLCIFSILIKKLHCAFSCFSSFHSNMLASLLYRKYSLMLSVS